VITATAHGRVSLLQIDRPERRNALDTATCDQLREAVLGGVDAGARAVVITGRGTSFCSGADLSGVYGDEFLIALRTMLQTITDAPVPVIAAVNGPAIGAGTQLAVSCDFGWQHRPRCSACRLPSSGWPPRRGPCAGWLCSPVVGPPVG